MRISGIIDMPVGKKRAALTHTASTIAITAAFAATISARMIWPGSAHINAVAMAAIQNGIPESLASAPKPMNPAVITAADGPKASRAPLRKPVYVGEGVKASARSPLARLQERERNGYWCENSFLPATGNFAIRISPDSDSVM